MRKDIQQPAINSLRVIYCILKKYNICCSSLYNSIRSSDCFFTLQKGTVRNAEELMDFLYFRSLLWETVITFERLHSLIIHIRSVTVCMCGCGV